jgi:hypothetical protein
MSVGSRSSKIALSLALVGAGVAAGSGQAYAGSDGQHVEIQNKNIFDEVKGGWIKGTNWNNHYVQQWIGVHWSSQEAYQVGDSDWWWKGTVHIDWVHNDSSSSFAGTTTCSVPVDQGSDDWVTCIRK